MLMSSGCQKHDQWNPERDDVLMFLETKDGLCGKKWRLCFLFNEILDSMLLWRWFRRHSQGFFMVKQLMESLLYFFCSKVLRSIYFLIFPLLLYILIAYSWKRHDFSSFKEQDSSFGGLEKCITLLKGSNDEQRLVGLLLATKYVQGNDKDSVRKIFNAVGVQFINRLLRSG